MDGSNTQLTVLLLEVLALLDVLGVLLFSLIIKASNLLVIRFDACSSLSFNSLSYCN
jgi:hypothetical protein